MVFWSLVKYYYIIHFQPSSLKAKTYSKVFSGVFGRYSKELHLGHLTVHLRKNMLPWEKLSFELFSRSWHSLQMHHFVYRNNVLNWKPMISMLKNHKNLNVYILDLWSTRDQKESTPTYVVLLSSLTTKIFLCTKKFSDQIKLIRRFYPRRHYHIAILVNYWWLITVTNFCN